MSRNWKRRTRKPPEEHRVLPQHVLEEIERTGNLVAGPNIIADVRSPKAKGLPGAYAWDPETRRMPVDRLKERYDADIWRGFEEWAKRTIITTEGTGDTEKGWSVWDWLNGTRAEDAEVEGNRRVPPSVEALLESIDSAIRENPSPDARREELLRILEIPFEERTEVGFSGGGVTAGNVQIGFEFVRRFTSKQVLAGEDVQILRRAKRANADRNGRWINGRNMLPKTVVHELGHIIEGRDPGILSKSVSFLASRTKGELPVWLGPGYGRRERALRDEWVQKGGSAYAGKVYRDATGDYASEILSMGLQRLFEDPAEFYLRDREFFVFVVNVIRGL
jgi:hypothetical protein